jgi:pimeloyl-ACP methyl ester carboxylesterase
VILDSTVDLCEAVQYSEPGYLASAMDILPAKTITIGAGVTEFKFNRAVHSLHFEVPLNHLQPAGQQISIHGEIYTRKAESARYSDSFKTANILVYLCGGPGSANHCTSKNDHLVAHFLRRGKDWAVLYLHNRGCSPEEGSGALSIMSRLGHTPDEQVDILAKYTQVDIARDLEAVRLALKPAQWHLFGQSYGGWIAISALSHHPDNIDRVYLTGGLPPIGVEPQDVYTKTFGILKLRNKMYFDSYIGDQDMVKSIVKSLYKMDPPLNFERMTLTAQVFMTMGRLLGSEAGMGILHEVVGELYDFLAARDTNPEEELDKEVQICMAAVWDFTRRPLYALLHESIYFNGHSTDWAALQVGRRYDEFFWLDDEKLNMFVNEPTTLEDIQLYFSGEMVYPLHFAHHEKLKPYVKLADKLARYNKWPALYDIEQLQRNKVPVCAIVYEHDMFVSKDLSFKTATMVGSAGTGPRVMAPGKVSTTIVDGYHADLKDASKGLAILELLDRMALDGQVPRPDAEPVPYGKDLVLRPSFG